MKETSGEDEQASLEAEAGKGRSTAVARLAALPRGGEELLRSPTGDASRVGLADLRQVSGVHDISFVEVVQKSCKGHHVRLSSSCGAYVAAHVRLYVGKGRSETCAAGGLSRLHPHVRSQPGLRSGIMPEQPVATTEALARASVHRSE